MSDTPNTKNDLLALLQGALNKGEEIKIKSDGKKVRVSIPAEQLTSHAEEHQPEDQALRRRVPNPRRNPFPPFPGPNGRIPPQWPQPFPQPAPWPNPFPGPDGRIPNPFPPQPNPFPNPFPGPDGRIPNPFPPQPNPFPNPFPGPDGRIPNPFPPQPNPFPNPFPGPDGRIPNPFPPQPNPFPVPDGRIPNPIPQPNPPLPNPVPGKTGPSYVNIMIQDPATPISVGGTSGTTLKILLPEGLPANLQGSDIIVSATNMRAMPPIVPDTDNNVLLDPVRNPKQFEAVSVYAIVKSVKNMYERVLKRKLVSSWGNQPITLILNDQEEANAFFGPMKRALIFRFFRDITTGQTVYTSLMYDVITHEAGHWLADCLQPQWIFSNIVESQAIHEAVGDMTTILALLDNRDVCSALAQATGGDLHIPSFFSNFSEQFGMALLRKNNGLRNADDNVKMGEVTQESHDLSRVLVGAVYDILAEMVNESRKTQPAERLPDVIYEVGEQMKVMVLQAIVNAPARNPTFNDFIRGMSNAAPTPAIKAIVERIAVEKLIGASGVASMPAPLPVPLPLPFPQMPRQAYLPLRTVSAVEEDGKYAEVEGEEVLESAQTAAPRPKRARAAR